MQPTVEFWFEFASTYSYPAAERMTALAAGEGVRVNWMPFLLGPIFAAQGWDDSPFNLYPAKGRYMWRDVERTCATLGVPFARPTVFPRNGLLAARVALVADDSWRPDFVRRVYRANFAEDRDIASADVVTTLISELGRDPSEVLTTANGVENKTRLRERTERAAELGIFGSPTMVVERELFWGNDRLEAGLRWARSRTGQSNP